MSEKKTKLKGDGQKLTKVRRRHEPHVGNRARSARTIAKAAGSALLGALLERLRERFSAKEYISAADLHHELNACELADGGALCDEHVHSLFTKLREKYPTHERLHPGVLHDDLDAFATT